MTFSKTRIVRKILEEEGLQPGEPRMVVLHECFGKGFDPDKGPCGIPRPFEAIRHVSDLKGDGWLFQSGFSLPEVGNSDRVTPSYACERGQVVGAQVAALIAKSGDMILRTEYVHKSSGLHETDGSSPMYNELFNNPILICPHRSLEQLLYEAFFAVFGLQHDLELQVISNTDGDDICEQLLHCPFCDTKVEILITKRGTDEPPVLCKFTSVRNLGSRVDVPDRTWYSQTMFSSESVSDTERELRNPWRVRVRGTRPWAG